MAEKGRFLKTRFLAVAVLALTVAGVGRADTTCLGTGCGGSSFSTSSPTFTGTTTVDEVMTVGAEPTCAVTGAGAAGTCTIPAGAKYNGSTDMAGTLLITTDAAGTAAAGTITLTFASAAGPNFPVCLGILVNDGVAWATTATVRVNALSDGTACVWSWNNTAALTVSDNYAFSYVVIKK